jgi:adenosylcobinamide-GDP ribazoletransferase
MKRLLLALQFLTILPVRVNGTVSEKEIASSAAFFPVVGAFQGLILVLSVVIFARIFPPEIVSGIIILILIITNGGFHLDGLSDTFDAIAVKSSSNEASDKEKRLAVMKGSTAGPIGVTAIVLTIMLKYLLIEQIFQRHSSQAVYFALILMPAFSKWVMVPCMHHGISARQDGLGRIFFDNVNVGILRTASLLLGFFYVLAAGIYFFGEPYGSSIVMFFVIFSVLYVFGLAFVKFCRRKFGGLTGDNLGAAVEISEIIFLMVVIIWLQHYI